MKELRKLQLDMASVLEEKKLAEKKMEESRTRLRSTHRSVETLRREIEEMNEEQVVVELARIEALKEFAEIQAQREKESVDFSSAMRQTSEKIKNARDKIERSKGLESKLAVSLSDVNVLQNELKLVNEMERRVKMNLEHSPLLNSITEELEAAKKELASIKDEGLQLMGSMDIIRRDLNCVEGETSLLKKKEEKVDLTVQNLNSKLLRANSELKAAISSEEKAKVVVSNLSFTLERLNTEAEEAKKEKELIDEETAGIRAGILKIESEAELKEQQFEAATLELETINSAESSALEKLQNLLKNTMIARACVSQNGSSIAVSKVEYEYLTGRAGLADEIADKKIAAAQAWIEALKASEKEMMMKIEMVHREAREMRVEEEEEIYRTENSQVRLPRKSMGSGNSTPSRRAKLRNSDTLNTQRMPRATSFTLKRRLKFMPNLAKLTFGGERIGQDF